MRLHLVLALAWLPLAAVLRIIGLVCLFLLAINAVLLLLALSAAALDGERRPRRPPAGRPRPSDDSPAE